MMLNNRTSGWLEGKINSGQSLEKEREQEIEERERGDWSCTNWKEKKTSHIKGQENWKVKKKESCERGGIKIH